jgi:hypothetical protein
VTWLNTSVQTGFARSASEAMFPRLFPDAGWWCPSLNPAMGGTRLWDLSGRQNWATLTNMANDDWVVRNGKGMLDFDASNDFASTSASSSYNVGNSVTVSAFAFPTSNGTAAGREVCSVFESGSSPFVSYGIDFFNSNFFGFSIGTTTNVFVNLMAGSAAALNRMTHICGTYDGQQMKIYIDGALSNSANETRTIKYTANTFWIGRWGGGGADNHFGGLIDDIRIYSRALTAGEVRQLWQIGRGNMPLRRRRRYTEQAAGFKAYWARNRSSIIGAGNVSS